MKLTTRAATAPGPSSAPDNNNVSYALPGFSSLSGLLTQSFAETATSAQGLEENLDKDLQLYMSKATLYNLHLSNQATVNENGVKELAVECPLRFWFGQVNFTHFLKCIPKIIFVSFRLNLVTSPQTWRWLPWTCCPAPAPQCPQKGCSPSPASCPRAGAPPSPPTSWSAGR